MKILNSDILEMLNTAVENISIIDWTYLNDDNNNNFKEIVKKFYPWERERAKILNPWSYLGTTIKTWNVDYFGKPELSYAIDWEQYIEWILTTWYARLKVNVDTNQLESVDPTRYFYYWGTEYFLTYFTKEITWSNFWETYKNYDKYVMLETLKDKAFERRLFKVTWFDSINHWEEVSLDTIPETASLPSELKIDIDRLVIEEKIDDWQVQQIKTIIYSIDKKKAFQDHNIMDYWESWTILKNIDIPDYAMRELDDWQRVIDFDRLWKILVSNDIDWGQAGVEIVKATFEGIQTSMNIIESQFKDISRMTAIPNYAFWDNTGLWTSSGESRRQAKEAFYKRIWRMHNSTQTIFTKFHKLINRTEEVIFPTVISKEDIEILEEQEKLLNLWLTSRLRAIMQSHKVDEKEANIILKEIENDTASQSTETENT